MGGKGEDKYTPVPTNTQAPSMDMDMMMGMMGGYMDQMMNFMSEQQASMSEIMNQQNQSMQSLAQMDFTSNSNMLPAIQQPLDIDWTEQQAQLASKMKADYNIDQTRRKSRQDTVLTSPLLDEEDAETTTSLLEGK